MRVITVARKPLSEPSVAANVLRHGTGALNIDACRIRADLTEMAGRSGTAEAGNVILGAGIHNPDGGIWKPSSGGRWPANLILQHPSGCQRLGTKRVPGISGGASQEALNQVYGKWGRFHPSNHADLDGTGVVDAWECAPGCPVADLDRQSGVTTSCRSSMPHMAYEGDSVTGFLRGESNPDNQYEDTGGASRFFRQVGGIESEPG